MLIIGVKTQMTRLYNKYKAVPVTVLDITENVVASKLQEGEKYYLLIGYGRKKHPTKAEMGIFKELGYVPQKVKKVEVDKETFDVVKIGPLQWETVEKLFKEGAVVDVSGVSKGKGFAGVIKRWGFSRQPKTHGQSDRERHGGAIGAQTPGRVLKGKKMAGRMGNKRVTVKNLSVVKLLQDKETGKGFIIVKGSVPGAPKGLVEIKLVANANEG